MLDPVFDFFEKLITAFTWRRLLLIISLIGMALAGFVVYEYYTGHFRLGRIERAASALEHLAKLEPSLADRNNQTLSNTLKGLENDLHGYVTFSSTPFNLPEPALKFLAAIVPWLFLGVIFSMLGGEDVRSILAGLLIMAPIPVISSIWIPTCPHPWVSYIIVPIILCAIPVTIVTVWWGRKTKNAEQVGDGDA